MKGRARREEILRVAVEVFAAQGYRGGSLSTIARQVGLSEAGVLHHFPSKEHLLVEVLRRRDVEEAGWLGATAADDDVATSWSERLLEVGRRIVARPELARLHSKLAGESLDADHPAHAWFRERNRWVRQTLAEGLAAEQRAGRFPRGSAPDLAAAHLLAVFEGLQAQWLLAPDEIDLVAALADYLALFDGCLAAPSSKT
ncbi:TetR/AcrR family transcriptional regulator [Frankia sp. Mgl5]|uniref:TetR/AcrR family transcriptional regulator n=1 Tax=Frankia sp. Mgl5 TaxID=2933793 RepID=UPI00200E2811|nr:TetR/AcrR family transcriptional regulator [Frankia sp. Mgl5]MCK9931346.1 TetR/AcrR family transcriptional regulator [Frankia sp. Mgl5]